MPRLFFASLADEATRAELAALAAAITAGIAPTGGPGRAVPMENLHVTLAFVGAVPPERVESVLAVGAGLKGAPCELTLEALECWPPAGVLVLAARRCPPELALLHYHLAAALAHAGFEVEAERFRPHVTLARKVVQAPVLAQVPPLTWRVREVALLASDTSGKTSRYTVLATWPLLDK
jgi:2'-5' RNA ligase